MSLHRLARHPDTRSTAISRIEVELERDALGVRLCYRMIGDAGRVVIAPHASGAQPQRRDELWRSTCCELFLRDANGPGYREYNFAPCGDWAAYRFSGYRAGGTALETSAPEIELERSTGTIAVIVTMTEPSLDGLDDARSIALACVIETDAGLSYWALAHPPGKPDFHHASAFKLTAANDREVPSRA
jgi:hypothetical protein